MISPSLRIKTSETVGYKPALPLNKTLPLLSLIKSSYLRPVIHTQHNHIIQRKLLSFKQNLKKKKLERIIYFKNSLLCSYLKND